MANKDRNKRSVRKARAEERARVEAAQAASAPKASSSKAPAKAEKKVEKNPEKKAAKKSDKKPGLFRRLRNYLGDVRSEMKRVVWPSKDEPQELLDCHRGSCSLSLASSSGSLTPASSPRSWASRV